MKDAGLNTPAAPILPKLGWRDAAISGKNTPLGKEYAPVKYRIPIDTAVNTIPMIPNKENGASDDKFFIKHRGSNIVEVIPIMVWALVTVNPNVEKIDLKVSPRIILYARIAQVVLKVQLAAGMILVSLLIDFSQASRYELALVIAQTRPISEKP